MLWIVLKQTQAVFYVQKSRTSYLLVKEMVMNLKIYMRNGQIENKQI